jgi:MFS family permease
MMDKKLDAEDDLNEDLEPAEEFKFSDLKVIVTNRGFWYIAVLCVLFYSAVFPFYKYGPDLMVNKFGVPEEWAGVIPSLVPFGTMFLTPFFGGIYDKKGKGATIMIIGAVMLIVVHVIYWAPFITNVWIAVANAILLGIAFSLVPSAMWPSVPKIIPEKQLGSAYAFIFWVQNWGLMGIPFAVGVVLEKMNPGVAEAKKAGEAVTYDYTNTWLIFIGLTILALVFALLLKAEDKKMGYGLELPNMEEETA